MLERVGDWGAYLSDTTEVSVKNEMIRRYTQTGRPLGNDEFVKQLEVITGKSLAPRKPGRKADVRK
jgi:putative transposase